MIRLMLDPVCVLRKYPMHHQLGVFLHRAPCD